MPLIVAAPDSGTLPVGEAGVELGASRYMKGSAKEVMRVLLREARALGQVQVLRGSLQDQGSRGQKYHRILARFSQR